MRRFLLVVVIICVTCAVSVSVISIVSGEHRRPFKLEELFHELVSMDYGMSEFRFLVSELDYIWNGLAVDSTYGLDTNFDGRLDKSEIDKNGDGVISKDEYDIDGDGVVSDDEIKIVYDVGSDSLLVNPWKDQSDILDSIYNVFLTFYKIVSFLIHGITEIIRYLYLYFKLIYKCIFGVPVA